MQTVVIILWSILKFRRSEFYRETIEMFIREEAERNRNDSDLEVEKR